MYQFHFADFLLKQHELPSAKYSFLTIKKITKADQGRYSCNVIGNKTAPKTMEIRIKVFEPSAPSIAHFNRTSTVVKNMGDSVQFDCKYMGLPKPIISWSKVN